MVQIALAYEPSYDMIGQHNEILPLLHNFLERTSREAYITVPVGRKLSTANP